MIQYHDYTTILIYDHKLEDIHVCVLPSKLKLRTFPPLAPSNFFSAFHFFTAVRVFRSLISETFTATAMLPITVHKALTRTALVLTKTLFTRFYAITANCCGANILVT